ncbi:MAG: GTP cyclohydrolase I FolE [Candidatus Dadabacteria bacterium]|nr:GTP cyclohydrolase I FolE [Candidatus Dadabacteria bacterium]
MGIQKAVKQILTEIGEDPAREGLEDTPLRIERMMKEITSGYGSDPMKIAREAVYEIDYDEMVIVKDTEFYSMCEHHMLPFFGKCHVAYIPNKKIIGLSKIPRIIEVFSRRLQVQERMTVQIANLLKEALSPKGVAVVVKGYHLCMAMRGVEKSGANMITSSMNGLFRSDERSREEFLSLIKETGL